MSYRYIATTPEGLVQQVAVSYLRHGYWWYVTGRIPAMKAADSIDQKLLAKPRCLRWARCRSVIAISYLASDGHHAFKQHEREQIRDCRRHPIRFEGYSLSYRRGGVTPPGGGEPKWHACVRIEPTTYKQLKAYFLTRACHRTAEHLAEDFRRIPYARYAPIRRQLLNIHRAVNRARDRMGYDPVPVSALCLRRRIALPFAECSDQQSSSAAA